MDKLASPPRPVSENLRDAAWQTEHELGYPLDIMAELYYEFSTTPTPNDHE